MIPNDDIKTILLNDVKANAVFASTGEIVKNEHSPVTEGDVNERIVIVLPGGCDNGQMQRSYPRVCIYVPKTKCVKKGITYYRESGGRIKELERECINMFRSGVYGETDGESYIYKLEEMTTEDDPETWSNFLNVKLKFEVVNTKL
jgi:hypothetical protein